MIDGSVDQIKGVFPVTATIAFLPFEHILSVNTDS